ncbi:MAG: NAD(P)/FAD-dependent oxidoreductase [Ferruginibacter sp.]
MQQKKLAVIGGGAAGFFCAVNAARMYPGLQVLVAEKSAKILSKVKVSGGGRCNVTHACFSMADMLKNYPRGASFLKRSFHRFFTTDTIAWFNERGVELKAEADGRMFPVTNDSQTIINCLLAEANKYGVQIMMNAAVEGILPAAQNFRVKLQNGKSFEADFVCIACGGFPKEEQFGWIKKLGHTIAAPVPSLFTFNIPANSITTLMGVSVENVVVKIAGTKLQQTGPLLITHWGFSGPAVLKLSAFAARELAAKNYHFGVMVNWLREYNENSLRAHMQQLRFELASQKIINRNPFALPARLWEYFLNQCGISNDMRWADLPALLQNKLSKMLCMQEFEVKGKTTFKEEFVTAGGISLPEVDAATMESRKLDRLFFAGEILDVDGITGGFNFQHAWTTGFIAARSLSAYI